MKAHAPKQRPPRTEATPRTGLSTRRGDGNQSPLESPTTSAEGPKAGPGSRAPHGFAHDFSRVPASGGPAGHADATPSTARQTFGGPGRPLETGLRQDME